MNQIISTLQICVEMYTNSGINRGKLNDRSVSQFLLHSIVVLPCKIFILLFISLRFFYMIVYLFISYFTDLYTIPLNLAVFIFVFNYCDRAISQSKFDGINSINLILKLMILYQSSRKKTLSSVQRKTRTCVSFEVISDLLLVCFFLTPSVMQHHVKMGDARRLSTI